jgi:arylsulfatase A-like enzyme
MKNQLNSLTKQALLASTLIGVTACQNTKKPEQAEEKNVQPNLVFVFGDQWRAQDLGYMGNEQVKTPAIDKLSKESANFTNTVATCPVCSPYRACLITGQYPLSHGIFYNDKPLNPEVTSIAKVYKTAGYETGYIGKWHLNGHPKGEDTWEHRKKPVVKERRQGFDFWKVLECTHSYNNSIYYDEKDSLHKWDGYDAIAQTKMAMDYIKKHKNKPFILFLSWGPPHAPYQTAPKKYKQMYNDSSKINLRPNVPDDLKAIAQKEIAGYYAHIAALDDCIADLQTAINEAGIAENTIFVFTSDHGDMLRSHGMIKKQKPWDESVHVPLLVKYPKVTPGKTIEMPIGASDLMPTLLGQIGRASCRERV